MRAFLAVVLCSFFLPYTNALEPVPQGFPNSWNGDSFVRSPGQIIQPVPKWLDGYLFCQLSASYGEQTNPEGQKVTHMFDAIGALAQIEIAPDYTTYTGAYYPSRPYKLWNFYDRDFALSSVPWKTFFSTYNITAEKMWNQIQSKDFLLPPNVDFWKVGNSIIAGTETYSVGLTFDIETTTNFRPYPFIESDSKMRAQPYVPLHMPTHERVDPDTGIVYSTVLALNIQTSYFSAPTFHQVIFTVNPEGVRTVEAVYDFAYASPWSCKNGLYTGDKKNLPRYMHSISSTERYLILPMTSSVVNPCTIFNHQKGPNYAPGATLHKPTFGIDWFFGYDTSQPFTFLLYDKVEKKFLPPIEAPTHQWAAHQLNAYEVSQNELLVDMLTYDDEGYKALYVGFVTQPFEKFDIRSHPLRFRIDLDKKSVTNTSFFPDTSSMLEFPQFNHRFEGKKYRYSYAVQGAFFADNNIIKIDMDDPSGKNNKIFKPTLPVSLAEPYFVPKPNSVEEDAGVLVMRALDPSINKTRIYIVDAKDMVQVGELLEPALTPFGFHERFYTKESLGLKSCIPGSVPVTTPYADISV